MQEDTDSYNENSNSEVIILPQNTHLEETLISDDEDTESETTLSYEAKLNSKLKDLGLYEDGMTIQQKEELLTVVAVSFKTAEEEKSRRQWYEEYANAALNFHEDEIEFSFQQSPESELDAKTSSCSGDYCASPIKTKKTSSSDSDQKLSRNTCSTSSGNNSNQNDHQNLPSTSAYFKAKPQPRRTRSRGGGSAYKLSLEEGNTVTSHTSNAVVNCKDTQCHTSQQTKQYLEKCMSRWRPCLSPRDEPLIRHSAQSSNELNDTCSQSQATSSKFMQDLLDDFHFAMMEVKKTRKNSSHFGKPYHLTRNEQCMRKATKVDSVDIMIGVSDDNEDNAGDTTESIDPVAKSQPFSRTSWGAFRYAQLHRDRIDALRNNSTIVNSHSSCITASTQVRYSSEKPAIELRISPEIVIEDDALPNKLDSSVLHCADSLLETRCSERIRAASETKLPKFSHLRPDLQRNDFSDKENPCRNATFSYASCSTTNSLEGGCKTKNPYKSENHIDSSCQDGDLSDCSSVIDVETIVDDEIDEFVLKRKLMQDSVAEKQTYSTRQKRLKKNASERS